mgnify:CR=1 FL=1
MQKNNIDTHFADKLKDRKINPSTSAWERLSVQLDKEQQKKKRKRFLYLSYAASVAVLISIGFFYESNDNIVNIENTIVNASIDTLQIKDINLHEISPIEEAIVNQDKTVIDNEIPSGIVKKSAIKKRNNIAENTISVVMKKPINQEIDFTAEEKREVILVVDVQKNKVVKSRIKVNSGDLLFAVTHSQQEVKEYYATYKIKRKDMLDTIQKELRRSNLKINPETILAEVEYDIEEADFKQNFMQKFKLKMSDVIVAIADRNK